MKKIILFLLLICSTPAMAQQCGIKNTAFKSGEFLYYDLYFNWKFIWLKVGTASMSTIESVFEGQKAYRTSLITRGILEFTDDYKRCLAGYNIPFTFHFWQILFSHYTHIHHYGDDMLMKHVYHNDVGQQNYDTLYSFCIEKKPSNTIDVGRLYHKYKKHLKTIRIFIYCSIIETIALIITLILLLL